MYNIANVTFKGSLIDRGNFSIVIYFFTEQKLFKRLLEILDKTGFEF